MTKNRLIKLILFCFGLSLLFALIYRIGFFEIIKIISGAKLSVAFLGVLVYLAVIFIRSYKFFLLTKMVKNTVGYRQFVPLYLVNYLIGNLTPFKSGETATPFLFKKYLKIPVGQGFSIIILDRFFELVIFSAILVSAVFYILNLGIQDSLILSILKGVLVLLFLLLVVSICVLVFRKITLKIVRSFKFLSFIEKELIIFYDALPLFKNKKVYQLIIPLTLVGWLFELTAFYLVFSSVLHAPFIIVAVAQIMAAAASIVAFIPAGVGIGEVSVVYILSLLKYPLAETASGVILASLFLNSTLLITGLAGFILVRGEKKYSFNDSNCPGNSPKEE